MLALGAIILSKFAEGKLPMLLCDAFLILLFFRRLNSITKQVETVSKGEIEYPSLVSILDSLMIPEISCSIWGLWLLFSYAVFQKQKMDFSEAIIITILISQIMFMIMIIVQQIFLSFFFTTCVGHGFFLFSLLPRIICWHKIILTSFIWFQAISNFTICTKEIQISYLLTKTIISLVWVYDFIRLLHSKDFPPEFGTKHESEGFQCPVCLETVFFYVTLPCSHHFCLSCFCKWGSIQNTCPVCRKKFLSWIHQAKFKKLFPISLVIM